MKLPIGPAIGVPTVKLIFSVTANCAPGCIGDNVVVLNAQFVNADAVIVGVHAKFALFVNVIVVINSSSAASHCQSDVWLLPLAIAGEVVNDVPVDGTDGF